jgi:hypothetical protein
MSERQENLVATAAQGEREKLAQWAHAQAIRYEDEHAHDTEEKFRRIAALLRLPAMVGEVHYGYLYFNPDTGIEWAPQHPVESGEVHDAEDVRPATLAALHAEMIAAWKMLQEERAQHKPAVTQKDDDPLEMGDAHGNTHD